LTLIKAVRVYRVTLSTMFNHILIPTDGSPLSSLAVEKSLAFARDAGAKVTVLTVVEPFHIFSSDPNQLSTTHIEFERHARERAAEHLTQAQLKARALGVPCEVFQVQHEHPYQAIMDAANKRSCDLISMASHGRGGLVGFVLGSETVKVLTHSTIPVLVYR
jgi:nucleotide-binding universal stress UspA family protein